MFVQQDFYSNNLKMMEVVMSMSQCRGFCLFFLLVILSMSCLTVRGERYWSQPVVLEELGEYNYGPSDPFLTADGLELYYAIDVSNARRIWVAKREVSYGPFTYIYRIDELNNDYHTRHPWLSDDGLRMYFSQGEYRQGVYIKMAERANRNSPWTITRVFGEIHLDDESQESVTLTPDELTMYWSHEDSDGLLKIFKSERASLDDPFGDVEVVSGLLISNGQAAGPSLADDGLSVYASGRVFGLANGIYRSTRDSLDASWGTFQRIDDVSTVDYSEIYPFASNDESLLIFDRIYDTGYSSGLYMSNWVAGSGTVGDPCGAWYVDSAAGSDDYDGLGWSSAFGTIQHAIEAASAGDTILIKPGFYSEQVNLRGKALTLQGYEGAATIMGEMSNENLFDMADYANSTSGGVVFENGEGADTILKNLIICGFSIGVVCNNASPTLENLTIADNIYGVAAWNGAAPTINSCIFANAVQDIDGADAGYCSFLHYVVGTGNISADPCFVDRLARNYRLRSRAGHYEQGYLPWSAPRLLSELNDTSKALYAFNGCLSGDQRQIFYSYTAMGGETHLLSATRAHREASFGQFDNETLAEMKFMPWLNPNQSRMYGCLLNNGFVLAVATADSASTAYRWEKSADFSAMHVDDSSDMFPSLTEDELTLYFVSSRNGTGQLMRSTRENIGVEFDDCSPVSEINAFGSIQSAAITLNGQELYFSAKPEGQSSYDLYHAQRFSSGDFENISRVVLSTDEYDELCVSLSHDQQTLLFFSDRGEGRQGLWQTTRYWVRWQKDNDTSLCIDAGDPALVVGGEPDNNGNRINMGAYGGTAQASLTEEGATNVGGTTQPDITETMATDINGDGAVNMIDLYMLADDWLWERP